MNAFTTEATAPDPAMQHSTLLWTEFPDVHANTLSAKSGTWPAFIERIRTVGNFTTKEACPLVKLARFGTKRSPGGSIRHDDNLIEHDGIEGDYDAKPRPDGTLMSMDEALFALETHGIRAIVKPSASWTAEIPRLHVICPLSKPHLPADHERLVKRLNGALGGLLSAESFVKSQTYYFGALPTNDYKVLVTFDDPDEGSNIDELHELDSIAIGKPKQGTKKATGATTGPSTGAMQGATEYADPQTVQDLRSALGFLKPDSDDRKTWIDVAHYLRKLGNIGFELWDTWSQTSEKYDPQDQVHRWKTVHPDSVNVGYKAVFARAQAAGWVNTRAKVDPDTGEINQHIGGFGHTKEQVDAFKAEDPSREFFWDVDTFSWHEVRKPEPCIAKDEKPADTSPFDLSYPPGLAGQIAQHIFDSARMPVKSFAVAGALQTLSYLNGNKSWIGCSDTALNLYQCLSGATGSGKEGPRQAIKSILNEAFPLHLSGVSESVASAPALLRALETGKEQLILTDEFGIFLQIAISEKGSMHLKELVKELLTLYGLGRSSYAGKIYSDAKFNIGRIDKPYCSVFGTTTPLELVDGISQKAVDNGFLNRILFVQASEAHPVNRFAKKDVPETLLDGIKALLNSPPGAMQYEEGAHDFMVSCVDHMHEPGLFKNLWTRAEEQMIRVSGLLALGDGGVIKKDHVAWASQYVTWCIKSFSKFLGEDLAETSFQKTVAKASKLIRGARQYSHDKQFGDLCKEGLMPRSKLLKLMKLPAREMDDMIKYLLDSGTFAAGIQGGCAVLFDKA